MGVKFPEKKRYVTLEWPLCTHPMFDKVSVCILLVCELMTPEVNNVKHALSAAT